MKIYPCLAVIAVLAADIGATRAQTLPSYMAPIAGKTATTPSDIATKDVLALNTGMFELYGDAAKVFQKNILSKHPVILALFSGAGGRMILYRPGMAPIDAPQVPVVYQLLKSVGHSTMALAEVVGPYVDNPDDKSWRGSMLAYRSRMQSALDGLDATPIEPGWRDDSRTILQNNIAFMDDCVAKGVIPFATLEAFGKKQAPYLAKTVAWAAQTQVAHWMTVLADWKTQLGADWNKTYAASNTIYATRQNNVLFSVLAQFFGPDAINDRLLLIETASFTMTPADMLDLVNPHHRGSLGRRAVLRQLPFDGLRTDGRRRAYRHYSGSRQARDDAIPAAGRAVRLEAMADIGDAGAGTGIHRRLEIMRAARGGGVEPASIGLL